MWPSPELPDRALLLHEQLAEDEHERDANSRFYVRDDGAFFHSRNRAAGDPGRPWDTDFPDKPVRQLDAGAVAELRAALAGFPRLAARYARPPGAPAPSHPVTERWTAVVDGRPRTVVVEEDAVPPPLAELRALIDRLVAASARA